MKKCKCKQPNFKQIGAITVGNEKEVTLFGVKTCQNCLISETCESRIELEKSDAKFRKSS